jgi:2-polyprenyl-3-methyl-5-hydroxy-6-metoxy-1,4-benzoquinol methylase
VSTASSAADHWESVYATKPLDQVSWHQQCAATSVRLVTGATDPTASVIDVGAGASPLVEDLLRAGYRAVTVLDVSEHALAVVRARLGDRGGVTYVVADLLAWSPDRTYDVWHDRAVFHFLTDPADRDRYIAIATRAVTPGGVLVLGTFAADGPTSCSGLPTARYDADSLAALFAGSFTLRSSERQEHRTPGGAGQAFTWVVLVRAG